MAAFARLPLLTTLAYSIAEDGTKASLLEAVQPPPSDSSSALAALLAALELAEDSTAQLRRKPQRARPKIGGNTITWAWLKSLERRECIYRFRFTYQELRELVHALKVPESFWIIDGCHFSNVEALCFVLARFRGAEDVYDLSMKYNRAQGSISLVINEMCTFLDDKWKHLLYFDHTGLLSPERLAEYAEAIHMAGAPLRYVWGFVDCTIRSICHPVWLQQQVYNGHKKEHSLKYQGVTTPNGMIAHLWGPEVGRRNDNYLLSSSGLLTQCYTHANRPGTTPNTRPAERYYYLFGDPAYGLNPVLVSPYAGTGERTPEEADFNAAMSAVRIEVEHSFGQVTRLWPFVNAWWKHKLWASPIGHYYRVAVLLTNAHNCIHPNQTSQYFQCPPPDLDEYFHE